jgi:hypothetical protein
MTDHTGLDRRGVRPPRGVRQASAPILNLDCPKRATRWTAWPARYRDHVLGCPVAGHEPVIAVLPRDPESRRHEQQFELSREVDMAGEVGNQALGQRALVEAVVDQAHVGALQVRLVCRRGASEQPCLVPHPPATGIDIEIDEGAWSHALGLGQRRQVRYTNIENEESAWTEQAKRGRPGATPIVESQ